MPFFRHWPLVPSVATALTLAACTLPPYTVNGTPFKVLYSMFVPQFADGVPLVTGLPAFADKQAPPTTIDVPQEAHSFNIADLSLNLMISNTGPVPLRIKIFLGRTSDASVYSSTPLGGDQAEIDLPRGGTEVDKTFSIDTALLKEQKLVLGYTFGSPGTSDSVTFSKDDAVNINYNLKASVKLF